MAFKHGKDGAVLFKENAATDYLSAFSMSRDIALNEITNFGSGGNAQYVAGIETSSMSLNGFFDGATDTIDSFFHSNLGPTSKQALTVAPYGLAVGNRCFLLSAKEVNYTIDSSVADAVTVASNFVGERATSGVSLKPLAAESSSTDGTAVDNSSSTANGAVANLHVTAASSVTGTIKVQHSADNSTWADLITFTAISGSSATSEIKTVTGTVNRYLRYSSTISAGSLTYSVAIGRLTR